MKPNISRVLVRELGFAPRNPTSEFFFMVAGLLSVNQLADKAMSKENRSLGSIKLAVDR